MQSPAYQRARTLLSSSRDALVARILGAAESLVVLALLTTAALLVSLLASRGEINLSHAELAGPPPMPTWSRSRLVGESVQSQQFDDSGLFPLIGGNLHSPNPVHRLAARWLDGLTGVLPPLRNNLGALATLLAAGLAFILLLSILRQTRRSAIGRAVAGLTTNLRNQIHRQMYRLGQSSLPTEGVGPVVNIWTREVNDIRDALVADLDVIPRMIVLGVGLAIPR
jgi:hypothetical protein